MHKHGKDIYEDRQQIIQELLLPVISNTDKEEVTETEYVLVVVVVVCIT